MKNTKPKTKQKPIHSCLLSKITLTREAIK